MRIIYYVAKSTRDSNSSDDVILQIWANDRAHIANRGATEKQVLIRHEINKTFSNQHTS